MQQTETTAPELSIDIEQLYQMLGMLTAENAALKLARAKDQQLIQQLLTAAPDAAPADEN